MTAAAPSARELLIAEMNRIVADDTKPLTSEEGKRFDELKAAVARLDAPQRTGSPNKHRFEWSQQVDTTQRAADTPANRRSYAKLFGIETAETKGFQSVEDLAKTMLVNDSNRLMGLSGQGIGTPSDGGWLVPESLVVDLMDRALDNEIVRSRCNVVPMLTGTKTVTLFDDSDHSSGTLFGGLTGTWAAEGDSIDVKTAKMRRVVLQAKKLAFLTTSSNELLEDVPAFEGGFTARMADVIAWNLDSACLITGTGSGQPLSILNDDACITVAKETGQAANTIVFENLTKMFSRLHPACINNSVWIANSTAIPQLLQLSIPVGTGGEFVPAMSSTSGQYQILTRPCIFSEKLSALGTEGDLLLCDLSQYMMGISRYGMRLDRSQHVRFATDETTFRVVLRVDGRGTWNGAFTPLHGNSLSWAVSLATRA